jgi:surface polysaccharide O-acyltransferase-like enzyme
VISARRIADPREVCLATERLSWADGARALAIVLVVAVHITSPLLGRLSAETAGKWWAGIVVDSVAQCGVPLFLMVSGALLLGLPGKANEPLRLFAAKRFLRVVVPFLAYSGIYFVWRSFYLGQHIVLSVAVRDLYTGGVFYHLWFVYLLIGLYALVPVLRVWIAHAPYSHKLYYLAISLVGMTLLSAVATQFGASSGIVFTGLTMWCGYFVFGGVLGMLHSRSCGVPIVLLSLMGAGSLAFSVLGTYLATMASGAAKTDFRHFGTNVPSGVLLSLTAALLVRHILVSPKHRQTGLADRAIAELSACSYGIYLLHPIVLTILHDGRLGFSLSGTAVDPSFGIPATLLATIAICTAAVAITRRIPVLRRLLS